MFLNLPNYFSFALDLARKMLSQIGHSHCVAVVAMRGIECFLRFLNDMLEVRLKS